MLNRIEHMRSELSRSEGQVADWILEHPRDALASTLAQLAQKVGTSEPTVVRFCRRGGVSGYSEFKLRLAEAMSRPVSFAHRDVQPGDGVNDAVMKVMDRSIQAIMNVRELSQSMPFRETIAAMAPARQWVFCGLGASGYVAQDACQKFFRLGTPCSAQADTPSILQTAAVLEEQDVLVLISHSGRWPEVARAARLARDQGAFVVALTQPGSAMARAASVLFDCVVGEDASVYTPMSSRLAHLALLDALQVSLALELGERANRKLQRSKAALVTP